MQKFGQPCGGVRLAESFLPISKNGKKWSILQNHPPNAQHRFAPLPIMSLKDSGMTNDFIPTHEVFQTNGLKNAYSWSLSGQVDYQQAI